MSRRNTKAIKSINRMYEQFNLKSDEIIHKTKLLLSIYRDVVWATLNESEYISDRILSHFTIILPINGTCRRLQ